MKSLSTCHILPVFLCCLLSLAPGWAVAQTIYTGPNGAWNNDTWNNNANWDGGAGSVPSGTVNVVIEAGRVAWAVNVTPAYTGSLTLQANAVLGLGPTAANNPTNALGTGPVTMESGSRIAMRVSGAQTFDQPFVLNGNATIALSESTNGNNTTRTFTGTISGSGLATFEMRRGNILNLNASNSWSGGFVATQTDFGNVNNFAFVRPGVNGAFGTGDVTINDGITLDIVAGLGNTIDNSATLTLNGRGRHDAPKLRLNSNETIGGLEVSYTSNPPGGSGTLIGGSGVLTVNGPANISIDPGTTGTIQNQLAGSAAVNAGGGGTLVLSAANSFTGGVDIDGATVRAVTDTSLGAGGPLSFSGADSVLDLRASPTVSGLSGVGASGLITAGAAGARSLTVAQGGDTTFGGVIEDGEGTVSLVKADGGSLTLTGGSTYSGGTTVSGGTLMVNNTTGSGTGSGDVTVMVGATLGGSGSIDGAVALNGGRITPGSSIGTLNTGDQVWTGNTVFGFEFSTDGTGVGGTDWDVLAIDGSLDLAGIGSVTIDMISMLDPDNSGPLASWDPLANATWSGFVTTTQGISGFDPGLFTIDTSGFQNPISGTFSVIQNGDQLDLFYLGIPEPSRALLVVFGAALLVARRRR